jgi:predicted NUDIX family NTP pyrophosphohydrolase
MPVLSAGIVLHRRIGGAAEVLLVHPGGPYWARKDAGACSIPKGLVNSGEDTLAAACREFGEETGMPAPAGEIVALGEFQQNREKTVAAFALGGDFNPAALRSNTFTQEWPPRSGRFRTFPEVDRAGWFTLAEAAEKVVPGQRAILVALAAHLDRR